MYKYVTKEEIKPFKSFCQSVLDDLKKVLKEKSVKIETMLIGSGADNLVTKNEQGRFDLDYNIIFTSINSDFFHSEKALKDYIRTTLDTLVAKKWPASGIMGPAPHGKDSTSAITYQCPIVSAEKRFSFHADAALIIKDAKYEKKLVNDKRSHAYIQNITPNFTKQSKKVKKIKQAGYWQNVKDLYLDKKNEPANKDTPSYAIYSMTVNEVYQKIKAKETKQMSKTSGNTHTQQQMNHHANQNNPNNSAYRAAHNNHSNQCNPNNSAYKGSSKK